ncbi:hypothetical protein [Streptomyces sp. SPB074]|uniref:hypothetical protein n=1 Tax=Streptomyces sp. (strain SPB074) TaxID=465543 RepID=UPI00017F179A|nr:hypothetical protein [Streptomyces sp. SPB074]EDY44406.1 hypothetical protein SSBG_01935 [Streptomyces sp. SPB074]
MPLNDTDLAALLAPAGLRFLARVRGEPAMPPLPEGGAASAVSAQGRHDARAQEVATAGAPDLADRLNAGWFRMAKEFRLLDAEDGFVIGVDYAGTRRERFEETHRGWARVRLGEEWDFVRSEVEQFRSTVAGLFTERYVPEFTALAEDGHLLLRTTVWGDGTVSTLAIRSPRAR